LCGFFSILFFKFLQEYYFFSFFDYFSN